MNSIYRASAMLFTPIILLLVGFPLFIIAVLAAVFERLGELMNRA